MRCIKSNRKDALCTWQMVIPQSDILADIKQIAPRIKKTKTITLIQGLEFETPSTFLSWWSILIFFFYPFKNLSLILRHQSTTFIDLWPLVFRIHHNWPLSTPAFCQFYHVDLVLHILKTKSSISDSLYYVLWIAFTVSTCGSHCELKI